MRVRGIHDDGHRAPLYSGIDITCGSGGMYGGLLIRELCNEHRWVFQRILRGDDKVVRTRTGNVWSASEKLLIQDLIHGQKVDSGILRLVPVQPRNDSLYVGPRIGLRKRTDDLDGKFRTACLRIATWQTAKPNTRPLSSCSLLHSGHDAL